MGLWQHLFWWIEVHGGISKGGPDPYYNFFSGIGSDLGEIALLGGLITMVHHWNCSNKGCWRISRHTTVNGHRLCRTHIKEPLTNLTLPEIHKDHQ